MSGSERHKFLYNKLNMSYPKISIVTPSFNQVKYLEKTILSILDQNYPNLEYLIIDGGSTDGSVDIIKKYKDKLTYWVSEPDNGLYHALQKGFDKTTGEIMGWLNSDDMLHRNSLFTLAEIFALKDVRWVQGIPSHYDEYCRCITISPFRKWSKFNFWQGEYQWIQQESTYWHRDLWKKSGGYISQDYKYAGDMELWNRFFKCEKLYSLEALIGGYRVRSSNQLALEFSADYLEEADNILKKNVFDDLTKKILSKVSKIKQKTTSKNKLRRILNKTLFSIKYHYLTNQLEKMCDYPPMIIFDRKEQKFCIKT